MEKLLFRRQFIFTNTEISGFKSFASFIISHQSLSWYLYCHKDLEVTHEKNGTREYILLGYILDPYKPSLDNRAILKELIRNESIDSLVNSSKNYCGRYALFYHDSTGFYLFNDPVAFREVYYLKRGNLFCCGSTPNILAEAYDIPLRKDKPVWEFFNSPEYKIAEYTWIGYETLYDKIFQLPPNHYLELNSCQLKRFWPAVPFVITPVDTVAQQCASIIRGTLESALNRYTLHMGITAGWDTRLLLTATRDFKKDIFYYINKPHTFNHKNKDLHIAKKLSAALDLKLQIIDIPEQFDVEFSEIFYKNNILAHDKLLPVFNEVYKRGWENTYTVSGVMGNGLARIYMHYPKGMAVTGKVISCFPGYQNLQYPIEMLDQWISEVRPLCENLNVGIMDLYQWEQENAHWATRTTSEQDIVRDEIILFNNRKLIELFWSLDPKYRYQYYPLIYVKIMKILWKEVLQFPINPSFRSFLYSILRTVGIEQIVYRFYKQRKLASTLNR